MERPKSSVMILFLLGLFSETQIRIVGSIGISELLMFFLAPIFYFTDLNLLKRHGFMPLLHLAFLAMVGCIMSGLHNDTSLPLLFKGFASTYAIFAIPIVFHHFIKDDLWSGSGFKWYCIGAMISTIITIFGFHTGVEMAIAERSGGDSTAEELFFCRHFGGVFTLPLFAFYQYCPTWLAVLIYIIPTAYTVVKTATGRSALLLLGITIFMLFYANRNPERMKRLHKRLGVMAVLFGISIVAVMQGYKYAALHGYLNENAQKKYESQQRSSSKGGALNLLKNGRSEFFIGLMAASQSPFWGYGPWPIDRDGIYESYLFKYGDPEAIQSYNELLQFYARNGATPVRMIPTHSFLVGNWVFYGLLGLPFWLYVLYKMLQLFKYLWTVPTWFGFFAVNFASYIWGIFFSPFSGRVGAAMFLTLMLLAIAAGKGKVQGYCPEIENLKWRK